MKAFKVLVVMDTTNILPGLVDTWRKRIVLYRQNKEDLSSLQHHILKVSNATALANTIKSVQEPTAATIHRRGCHFGSCIQAGS
jgi:hypothetical protein